MSNRDTILVIKDSLFEMIMAGGTLRVSANKLHHIDGYSKEDILTAIKELQQEASEGEETED